MTFNRRAVAALAATALAASTGLAMAPAAQAAKPKSLADVLLADTKKGQPSFDKNKKDFDILTAAVLTVLDAKPSSAVSVLTKPKVELTAFIPNDAAFLDLAKGLGVKGKSEAKVTANLAKALGVDTIESVLLYHVVPGTKITAKVAAKSDGAKLKTANGQKIKVDVKKSGIFLKDDGKPFPQVIATDIKGGKKQIAHVIDAVLIPKLG